MIPYNMLFSQLHVFERELETPTFPINIISNVSEIIQNKINTCPSEFQIKNGVAIHKSAVVEEGVVLKGPVLIEADSFVGANAYLRSGVYVGPNASVGPGCEVVRSLLLDSCHLAHFNYVGDSILGARVNLEAGAIVANHWNEKGNKEIVILWEGKQHRLGVNKMGALVGDGCKIGANAVLSPGTILKPNTIIKRLELVEQLSE